MNFSADLQLRPLRDKADLPVSPVLIVSLGIVITMIGKEQEYGSEGLIIWYRCGAAKGAKSVMLEIACLRAPIRASTDLQLIR
jgi:hypothetical protein